uniref:Uncharacterized protein n=1 Tax=Arion vulgaris TaxID=1028688 RepID=A0A0B6ZH83_9EUPU
MWPTHHDLRPKQQYVVDKRTTCGRHINNIWRHINDKWPTHQHVTKTTIYGGQKNNLRQTHQR